MTDKEKVIKGLEELEGFLFKEYTNIKAEESKIYYDRFKSLSDAIATLKEREAAKPKTGHWFKIHGGTSARCTICKCWGQINMKFCPWCGAKMET